MANILYSAYFCNPRESSESYTAVKWLDILLKEHNVTLLTNKSSELGLLEYYQTMPANLKIIGFDIPEWLEKKRNIQLHLGYFSFNKQSYRYLKAHKDLVNWTDVMLRKTPSSFRYYSSLSRIPRPLVVGPLGGGLQVPPELKSYFKKESLLNKLRQLDSFLLKFPPFRSQLKKADKILITLDYLRDILPQQYVPKMVTLFDTGIDTSNRTPVGKPAHKKTVNILYVGKLIRYKGAELLIKGIAPLKDKYDFHLHVVGDGVERESLKQLTRNSNLGSVVTFHGNLDRQQVFDFFQKADIFCAPSLTEASGNALLEAMLYSLPIVTIDNGGPKYMCPDNGAVKIRIQDENGIVREITDGLTDLINHPEKRVDMGMANFDFLQQNFSWQVLEKKINNFFHQYNGPTINVR
ncbi:glycosyltransferase family 4 protein [Paraflavitalea pollutisoli]|uniref:glycosyltransferase family 4 protein n=1 Tax=Paraflavitalea pollutisoli TaxID=3034143 RepID=UPI0023EAD48C|nr:glycosyltransferase family 4 protein [Paraflavitalea sp. H1-2-19X]